jgi:hypothetical protein
MLRPPLQRSHGVLVLQVLPSPRCVPFELPPRLIRILGLDRPKRHHKTLLEGERDYVSRGPIVLYVGQEENHPQLQVSKISCRETDILPPNHRASSYAIPAVSSDLSMPESPLFRSYQRVRGVSMAFKTAISS